MSYIAKGHPQQTKNIYPIGPVLPGLEDTWSPPDLEIDNRATDPAYFDSLNRRFGGFTVDVCADERNRKVDRFYDVRADGLAQSWSGERVWCNPPFSNIRAWVEKSWREWEFSVPPAELIVMLLPANRTEQKWWQELVEGKRDRPGSSLSVEFIPGRLRFVAGDQIRSNERPPFGCCLLIWQDAQLRPHDSYNTEGGGMRPQTVQNEMIALLADGHWWTVGELAQTIDVFEGEVQVVIEDLEERGFVEKFDDERPVMYGWTVEPKAVERERENA